MSGPSFTPGPWHYAHRSTALSDGMYSTEVFTPDGGSGKGVIATCSWYPMPADERGAIGTYREPNARLIAAAPELYEALQLHVAYEALPADRGGKNGAKGQAWAAFVNCRDAALAKVRGDA